MFEDDCDGNDDPPPMGQFVTISKNRKEKLENHPARDRLGGDKQGEPGNHHKY